MSESWPEVAIKDVVLGLYDGPHATPPLAEDGPVFLGIGNITEDGHLDLSSVRHIAEADFGAWTKRAVPRPGDIVFTYEATLNRYAIVPEGFRGCLGRRLALIRPDPSKVDTRFLHFTFFAAEWRATIERNRLAGATVDRIPLTRFPDFTIRLPPLPIQHKIAGVLSAYDDLIENNTRRIALLEEMAQALYREWFVEFRFPGHEAAEFVEDEEGRMPMGWEQIPFTLVASVLSGGTPRTGEPDYWGGSIPFYSPKDSPDGFYVTSTEKNLTEMGLENCNSRLYSKDTVFITARGTVGKMALAAGDMAMNQSCYALIGRRGITQHYLFLLTSKLVAGFKQQANGAVFDAITVATFDNTQVSRPPDELVSAFTSMVEPLFAASLSLTQRNVNLRRTRDLLLPRLISGDLEVGDLDVRLSGEATSSSYVAEDDQAEDDQLEQATA